MKTNVKTEDVRRQIDKYLTFTLADEHYGVEILKVLEIVGMLEITPVPRTPHFVRGVANLRGKIIPVVDLKRKFDMPAGETTAQTCIVVVRAGQFEAGLLVDRVLEVAAIAADTVEDPPNFGTQLDTAFIQGLAKTDARSRSCWTSIACWRQRTFARPGGQRLGLPGPVGRTGHPVTNNLAAQVGTPTAPPPL